MHPHTHNKGDQRKLISAILLLLKLIEELNTFVSTIERENFIVKCSVMCLSLVSFSVCLSVSCSLHVPIALHSTVHSSILTHSLSQTLERGMHQKWGGVYNNRPCDSTRLPRHFHIVSSLHSRNKRILHTRSSSHVPLFRPRQNK